jgi:hypothetical protein
MPNELVKLIVTENGTEKVLTVHKAWMALVQLWLLGQELLIPLLQHQVIQFLSKWYCSVPCMPTVVKFVYDQTGSDNSLRDALVTLAAHYVPEDGIRDDWEVFPHEMLADLVRKMLDGKRLQVRRLRENVGVFPTTLPECRSSKLMLDFRTGRVSKRV